MKTSLTSTALMGRKQNLGYDLLKISFPFTLIQSSFFQIQVQFFSSPKAHVKTYQHGISSWNAVAFQALH